MLRRNTNFIIFSLSADFFCAILAVYLAHYFRVRLPFGNPIVYEPRLETIFLVAGILYPLVFLLFSLYDPERTFRAADEFQILSIASLMAALVFAGLVYFTAREISRLLLIYFYIIHFLMAISWRSAARLIRKNQNGRGRDIRQVLLIGGGEAAKQAIERLNELSWAGVHLVGYLTDGETIPSANGSIPLLGRLKDAERVLHRYHIDDILIALPAEAYTKLQGMVTQLIDKPSNIWVVQDYFSLLIYGSHVEDLGGVPMINLKAPALTGYQRLVKRVFDLVFGTFLTIFFLPFMGIIALIIRLDSPGPVIFRQRRVGENGRIFSMYKFRTMIDNADQLFSEVIQYDEEGNIIHKMPNDPRVTKVGAFLRQTSLDELPQFFNVLKGEMSLVGPRPELPILVEKYETWQRKRFTVPQGITGWWQVNGRSDKTMHLNTEDDLYYVQNYSLLLDLQILLKTVWVVLGRRGAY
jgi:exopolysaccharide biosynthesis polyprenyl glycosylphosphotransferase